MTPMTTDTAGLSLAMAQSPDPSTGWGPILDQLRAMLPLLVGFLAIFYFIVLMPAKRQRQKVQAFVDALKVGDRVITRGGLHGEIVDVKERSVRLQISDNPKVRIEVSKAAIVGYQGQEPVAPENPQ
jgi:preprotein translocase subunit YajC